MKFPIVFVDAKPTAAPPRAEKATIQSELRIPLEEQIKWLWNHHNDFYSEEYGHLYPEVEKRLVKGSGIFGDTMFYMTDEELLVNERQEECDRRLYKAARLFRSEARRSVGRNVGNEKTVSSSDELDGGEV